MILFFALLFACSDEEETVDTAIVEDTSVDSGQPAE
tara:strand:+ start:160 stop:267 length:108 start_codon:yes stop_codon:yes gene_type:complete